MASCILEMHLGDISLSLSGSLSLFVLQENRCLFIEDRTMTDSSDGILLSEARVEDSCTLGQG